MCLRNDHFRYLIRKEFPVVAIFFCRRSCSRKGWRLCHALYFLPRLALDVRVVFSGRRMACQPARTGGTGYGNRSAGLYHRALSRNSHPVLAGRLTRRRAGRLSLDPPGSRRRYAADPALARRRQAAHDTASQFRRQRGPRRALAARRRAQLHPHIRRRGPGLDKSPGRFRTTAGHRAGRRRRRLLVVARRRVPRGACGR